MGFFTAWRGNFMMGMFCLVAGVAQLVFADLLHRPAEIFVCAYAEGKLTPRELNQGVTLAYSDPNPAMSAFLKEATVITEASEEDKTA